MSDLVAIPSKFLLPSAPTLWKYNLTLDQWVSMYVAQDGKCALCRKTFTRNRLPCVDHNHWTGGVRGLLCSPCNYELGCLHDDADWLARASGYLLNPTAKGLLDPLPIVQAKHRSKT